MQELCYFNTCCSSSNNKAQLKLQKVAVKGVDMKT